MPRVAPEFITKSLDVQICSLYVMLLRKEYGEDVDCKVARCAYVDGRCLARIHESYNQHCEECQNSQDRNEREGENLVVQVVQVTALCDEAFSESVLADADYGVHEDVSSSDEVYDEEVNGIFRNELGDDSHHGEDHADDKRSDRNAVLCGLLEELRSLLVLGHGPHVSCAGIGEVVSGGQGSDKSHDVDEKSGSVDACFSEYVCKRASKYRSLFPREKSCDDGDAQNRRCDEKEKSKVDCLRHILFVFDFSRAGRNYLGSCISVEGGEDYSTDTRSSCREQSAVVGVVGKSYGFASDETQHHGNTDYDKYHDDNQLDAGHPERDVAESLCVKHVEEEKQRREYDYPQPRRRVRDDIPHNDCRRYYLSRYGGRRAYPVYPADGEAHGRTDKFGGICLKASRNRHGG